jgi:hypothetical protein
MFEEVSAVPVTVKVDGTLIIKVKECVGVGPATAKSPTVVT